VTDLRSAPVPPLRDDDHVRGPAETPVAFFYADFTCPRCAVEAERLADADARVVFRHFALKTRHPRSVPVALAAEAAARQGRFWEFHDSLYEDQGLIDDPHLWARVQALALDLDRFEEDRRDPAIADRVRRDVRDALKAGATTTPAIFPDPMMRGARPGKG
jgi:protein-disulfide isomerase